MLTATMLLLSLVCAPLQADTGITVLMSHETAPYQAMLKGFQDYLRDNGVQGDYVIAPVGSDDNGTGGLAEQVQQQNSALVYCLGTRACRATSRLEHKRPVVASLILSPDAIAPDVQATGVFLSYKPDTQMQWLKKLFPRFRRVGVIYNPDQNQALIDKATDISRRHGLELVAVPIESPKELPAALKNLLRNIDVLWALPDKMVLAPQSAKEVLLSSFRNRIPVIGASAPWVKGGALYALDWDYEDMGAQNAAQAIRIIGGTPPGKIPMAEPRSVAYTLNLKTAKHMKLDIPEYITRGAKQVYQ